MFEQRGVSPVTVVGTVVDALTVLTFAVSSDVMVGYIVICGGLCIVFGVNCVVLGSGAVKGGGFVCRPLRCAGVGFD